MSDLREAMGVDVFGRVMSTNVSLCIQMSRQVYICRAFLAFFHGCCRCFLAFIGPFGGSVFGLGRLAANLAGLLVVGVQLVEAHVEAFFEMGDRDGFAHGMEAAVAGWFGGTHLMAVFSDRVNYGLLVLRRAGLGCVVCGVIIAQFGGGFWRNLGEFFAAS